MEDSGAGLLQRLEAIRGYHEDQAERARVLVSTTHVVKGREWDRVVLLDDFLPAAAADDGGAADSDQELAVGRAADKPESPVHRIHRAVARRASSPSTISANRVVGYGGRVLVSRPARAGSAIETR